MAIARRPTFILDCPDPEQLARFYADVLGWDVLGANDPMVFIGGHGQEMGFQRVADFRPPDWPGQVVPQQMHLDVFLDDLDAGEAGDLLGEEFILFRGLAANHRAENSQPLAAQTLEFGEEFILGRDEIRIHFAANRRGVRRGLGVGARRAGEGRARANCGCARNNRTSRHA